MTNKKDKDNKYFSCGTIIGICSSIVYLFTMSNLSLPPDFMNDNPSERPEKGQLFLRNMLLQVKH